MKNLNIFIVFVTAVVLRRERKKRERIRNEKRK